jgi:glycosyltransferase involved in cell wall biosynthesis
VPVRDPTALAEALRGLGDPAVRARFGAAARQRAQREFDERRVVELVLETYREVARAKGLDLRGL